MANMIRINDAQYKQLAKLADEVTKQRNERRSITKQLEIVLEEALSKGL